jgi:putative DNA primase/helicase
MFAARPGLRERTRGRWYSILTTLGVNPRYLVNKHGPCPICGGKDRFRYDNKDGDGTFICNQCGAGSGVDLVMRIFRLHFRGAAIRIERVIGQARPEPAPQRRTTAEARGAMNALWRSSRPVRIGDPVDRWFRSRAINIQVYPASLRHAESIPHGRSAHPGMLAMLMTPDGKPAHLHKTLFTEDAGETPRLFAPGVIADGAAVRLAACNNVLGLAEGIETAFAVMQLSGIPCWAALTAPLLEKFQPPPEVRHLIIYADNDLNQRGQRAGWSLAAKLAINIKVDVTIPQESDTDWNDVLRTRGGAR